MFLNAQMWSGWLRLGLFEANFDHRLFDFIKRNFLLYFDIFFLLSTLYLDTLFVRKNNGVVFDFCQYAFDVFVRIECFDADFTTQIFRVLAFEFEWFAKSWRRYFEGIFFAQPLIRFDVFFEESADFGAVVNIQACIAVDEDVDYIVRKLLYFHNE